MAIQRPSYQDSKYLQPGAVDLVCTWLTISATNQAIVMTTAAGTKGTQLEVKGIQKGAAGIYTVTFYDAPVDDYGFMADLQVPSGGPYGYAVCGPRSQAAKTLIIYTVAANGAALADPTNDPSSRITLGVTFRNTTLQFV